MNWLRRLWRGEIPLRRAFWIFAVLISIGLNLTKRVLSMVALGVLVLFAFSPSPDAAMKGAWFGITVMILLVYAYQLIACVGVWRSAGQYPGNRVYAILAKVAVVLFVAYMIAAAIAIAQTWAIVHHWH
jgi:hypothetical protein